MRGRVYVAELKEFVKSVGRPCSGSTINVEDRVVGSELSVNVYGEERKGWIWVVVENAVQRASEGECEVVGGS